MLKEFEGPVFEFAKRISRLSHIYSVLLFGSVASGEADKRSDIDFLVVFDTRGNVSKVKERSQVSEIALNIEQKYDKGIQLVFSNRDFKGLDRQFVEEVLRGGITLFGRTPIVQAASLRLQPYNLVHYSLSNLNRSDKMKVKRSLYGHKTKKSYKDKAYESRSRGLLDKLEGRRTGIASVLVPIRYAKVLADTLESFGVNYEVIDVWLPEA